MDSPERINASTIPISNPFAIRLKEVKRHRSPARPVKIL